MEYQTSIRRSRQSEMFGLVAEYENSGLTREVFCRQQDLKVATFAYWRSKYLASQQSADFHEAPGFVSLVPEQSAAGVELHFGQVKLCFGSQVPMDYIIGLVHKLSQRC